MEQNSPTSPLTPTSPQDGQREDTHPLKTQRSRPYYKAEQIGELCALARGAMSESKEQQIRFQACYWIRSVGEHLRFPVRTMGTAMVLFHRFHLFYPMADHFVFSDTAAACLFVACKMEDTQKKLREILLASYQVRHPNGPEMNIESQTLEDQRKRLIGLERMVLETSCFDFRFRHPQRFIIKFARSMHLATEVAKLAWDVSVDAYKTLLPLQYPPHVLALSYLDLAVKLSGARAQSGMPDVRVDVADIEEVVDELLNLYINYPAQTVTGNTYPTKTFLQLRIDLNRHRQPTRDSNGTSRQYEHESADLEGPVNGTIGDKGTVQYILEAVST